MDKIDFEINAEQLEIIIEALHTQIDRMRKTSDECKTILEMIRSNATSDSCCDQDDDCDDDCDESENEDCSECEEYCKPNLINLIISQQKEIQKLKQQNSF